jgi:hypothetical protein
MATTLLRDLLDHESAASGVVQTRFEFQLVEGAGREVLLPLMKWVVSGGGADGYGAAPDDAAAVGAAAEGVPPAAMPPRRMLPVEMLPVALRTGPAPCLGGSLGIERTCPVSYLEEN